MGLKRRFPSTELMEAMMIDGIECGAKRDKWTTRMQEEAGLNPSRDKLKLLLSEQGRRVENLVFAANGRQGERQTGRSQD